MSITREQLYAQVWAEPMTTVAGRHSVSSSFLARVCTRLNVPRPPRGYWARREVGQRVEQPPLPEPRLGDELEWSRGGDPAPARATASVTLRTGRRARKRRPDERPSRHPLLTAVREYFDAARVGYNEFLKPQKRLLVDVFVTKGTLPRALDVTNELFLAFEDRCYQVTLAPRDRYYGRPEQLDYRERAGGPTYGLDSWTPARPTVVFVGSLAFGLTVYEVTENVETHLVDGKWRRISEVPLPKRRSYHAGLYSSRSDLPSGRLALRAWCASGWVSWEERWRESKAGELPTRFNTIRRSLEAAVPELEQKIEEAQRKAEEERKVWEAHRREEERREAERRKPEAIKDRRAQFLAIVDRWAQARNLEAFFADAESRARALDEETQAAVLGRLARARSLLGGIDPLAHFSRWQAPEDRCADFQTETETHETTTV
jgi:hypothetical protein